MNLQSTKKIKKAEVQYTALYSRLSVDDAVEGDSNSIKNQKEMLGKYAEEHHFKNVRYYVDDGYSGTNFNRPDFQKMIEDIENGEISTVIVKDMSRFGRDHIMVGYYTQYVFPDADVRFIAIYDQVDSTSGIEDDITPFKNILNEMYAKDCSRKIKAVFKSKGNNGKHLSSRPPYGYVRDPENKDRWIIDEDAAKVVREAFDLCMKGYGPSQITRIFNEKGYTTPTVKKNIKWDYTGGYELWSRATVCNILQTPEYLGHTINFKYYKKSYKSKKYYISDKEDWVVFENTQEPIIDQATFDTVQKLREHKRRPSDMGEPSPLSGMLYCADCGKRMYLTRSVCERHTDHFVCSTYRKAKLANCTYHRINVATLTEMLLDDLRFTVHFAKEHKQRFLEILEQKAETATRKELSANLKELEESEKRIKSLDKIIQTLFEDRVEGRISDERFARMSENYEQEQRQLEERVKVLKVAIDTAKAQHGNAELFMAQVNKYSDFTELTPEIIRAFIDKVYVHEKTKVDGVTRQTIEIVYNFIGSVELPDLD